MVTEDRLIEPDAQSRQRVGQAAQMACLLEASALKPGNVNPQYNFADLRFEDFLLSALAIGPALEGAGQCSVGQTIWRATWDTRQVVKTNTNLGIVLLLAPLVKAAHQMQHNLTETTGPQDRINQLRGELGDVLSRLTVEDARQAYAAIRLAQAGALGQVTEGDVAEEPSINLGLAMALAQERDAIAREYVTNYALTFEVGYPTLANAYQQSDNLSRAIVHAYLTILSQVPDTLIARKTGWEMATQVSRWAAEAIAAGGALTPQGKEKISNLDRLLREGENHRLNPGTTADLTSASIFIFLIGAGEQPAF